MADPVSLAITVALNAATMAMTMMNKTEGPRLDDLTVSTADYGTPLVQIYGTRRVEAPCIYAEKIREEKHKQKGKAGKYVEYKYFGTWASLIADCYAGDIGPITDVLKIFFDRRLMYDKTGTGPISLQPLVDAITGENDNESLKVGQNCRIYKGSEDQAQDPRLLAKIEAKEGPGRCPAYLGVAYAVFEEIALEKNGNRLPQVSFVALRAPPANPHPYELHPETTRQLTGARFSRDFRQLLVANVSRADLWDVASRTLISTTALSVTASLTSVGMRADGKFFTVVGAPGAPSLWLESPYGPAQLITDRADFIPGEAAFVGDVCYQYMYGEIDDGYGVLGSDDVGLKMVHVATDYAVTHIFGDENGEPVFAGYNRNTGGTHEIVINGDHIASPTSGGVAGFDVGDGNYLIAQEGWLYLIDKLSHDITASVDTGIGNLFPYRDIMEACRPGFKSIYINNKEFSTTDLSLIRTLDFSDWLFESAVETIYDPINHALISSPQFGEHLIWRFLDRQSEAGMALGDICADAALQASMRGDQIDFSQLDQIVPGYSWTQGPAKDVVGALLEIYDSDIRPHGFIQQGLKRGQPLSGPPITTEWLVPESDSNNGDSRPLFVVPITAESDLPRRVWATFADPTMDGQPNTAVAQRYAAAVGTTRETSFDLGTLTIDPADIQPLIERALRRAWVGASKPECLISPLELQLEPGDVRHLVLEGEWLRCRATRTTIRANRVIDSRWEVDGEVEVVIPDWELDAISPLDQLFNSPGGYTQGRPPDVILLPQESKGFVLDVPLFSDADEQSAPFVYLGAAPQFAEGFWPGAGVWNSDTDDIETFEGGWDSFPSDQQCVWGVMVDALPDAATDVIDRRSSVEVALPAGGELQSVTEDAALADQTLNMAVIGAEIVQFLTADEIATNHYRLSGFVRGARGTEYAVAGHGAAESFVLVTDTLKRHALGASEIGDTDYYKFSTLGDNLDAVETIAVAFNANAHRPLSPCHLTLQRQADNDWLVSWQRRTRIGGSTINGQDVPLGETSELYRVRIMDGDEVFKTYEATDEQYLYTEAQQIADWGFAPSSLTVEVVQVSPALSIEGRTAGPVNSSANPHSGTAANQVGDSVAYGGLSGAVELPPYDVGDTVLIHIAQVSLGVFGPDDDPPDGWELLHSDTTHNPYQIVYGREMDGTEDPTVAIVWNGMSGAQTVVTCFALRGIVATGLTAEGQTQSNGSLGGGSGPANLVSPAITTSGADRRLFNFLAATRGTDGTQHGSSDSWTDIFNSGTQTLTSQHLDTAGSYLDAAGAGVQGTETRQETDGGAGLIFTYLSFAVIMA